MREMLTTVDVLYRADRDRRSPDSPSDDTQPFTHVLTVLTSLDSPEIDSSDSRSDLMLCERIYRLLNLHHPAGWQNRSMSMGDMVVINSPHRRAYITAEIGFEATPAPDPADINYPSQVAQVTLPHKELA